MYRRETSTFSAGTDLMSFRLRPAKRPSTTQPTTRPKPLCVCGCVCVGSCLDKSWTTYFLCSSIFRSVPCGWRRWRFSCYGTTAGIMGDYSRRIAARATHFFSAQTRDGNHKLNAVSLGLLMGHGRHKENCQLGSKDRTFTRTQRHASNRVRYYYQLITTDANSSTLTL